MPTYPIVIFDKLPIEDNKVTPSHSITTCVVSKERDENQDIKKVIKELQILESYINDGNEKFKNGRPKFMKENTYLMFENTILKENTHLKFENIILRKEVHK